MTDANWHILVTTRAGAVSILKNLDKVTAQQVYRKLDPWSARYSSMPAGTGVGANATASSMELGNAHDVMKIDVLGPEGEDLFETSA